MKKLKLSAIIFIAACIYYMIYNTYFGWNLHPQSAAEQLCDEWWHSLVVVSFIIYIHPALQMYENALRKMDQQKTIEPGDIVHVEGWTTGKVIEVRDSSYHIELDGHDYSAYPILDIPKSKCTLVKKRTNSLN